jgi:uroporphyrin-III C-methyltransferase
MEQEKIEVPALERPPAQPDAKAAPGATAPETKAPEPPREPTRRVGIVGMFLIALVAALVVIAPLAWQWFLTRADIAGLQQSLAQKLAEAEGATKETRLIASQAQEAAREAQVKHGVLEAKLAEFADQQDALQALYQELAARSREEWALNEVEQLLVTANQQLELAGNVKAALSALESADQRLSGIERPGFMALRKTLASEIERLQALPEVDVTGISVRLDNMIEAVDTLPLEPDVRSARPPETRSIEADSSWLRIAREIWADIKGLIRVRRSDVIEPPLLVPEQAFFLRENLKLRLLSARLNLLSHREAGYKADLDAASQWLTKYYDSESKKVRSLVEGLDELKVKDISIDLPTIAASVEAVRKLKDAREAGGR